MPKTQSLAAARAAFDSPAARRERLQDWRALCEWLEEQPYNASYRPKGRGADLLLPGRAGTARLLTEERLRMPVYWASGFGWRLNKGWRERLDAEERAVSGGGARRKRRRGMRTEQAEEVRRLQTQLDAAQKISMTYRRRVGALEQQVRELEEARRGDLQDVLSRLSVAERAQGRAVVNADVIPVLAGVLAVLLDRGPEQEPYSAVEWTVGGAGDLGLLILTLQRADGPAPLELKERAERRLDVILKVAHDAVEAYERNTPEQARIAMQLLRAVLEQQ